MTAKLKPKPKKLSKREGFAHGRFSKANLVIFAVIFAAIGGYFIYSSFAAGPTCSQTFTPSTIGSSPYPGSAVNTAVKNAPAGTTLCFASGSYSEIDIYGARPSSTVTLTPASGAAANLGWLNLNGVSNLTVTGFTGSSSSGGMVLQVAGQGTNDHFTFSNNHVTSAGVVVRDNTIANANIKIDNNTFTNWSPTDQTARIKASNMSGCPNGVTISNNLIDGGAGDGIETGGNSCGTQILNNEVSNIIESQCGTNHCDGFQDLGGGINTVVSGNYFHDDSDCFLLDDGSTNVTISNNLCTNLQNSSYWLQFGGASGITFDHNTIAASSGGSYGNDHNGNPSSNVKFTNNIIYQMPINNPGQPISGTFTNDYNICQGGCGSGGSHNISGTPSYVGGSSPSTISGFALTTSSLGHNAASDGSDMGANINNVGIQVHACTQTLNPGDSVATAVQNAAAGSVICLNAGNYGSVTLGSTTGNKSGEVIVQPVNSSTVATLGLTINSGVTNLTFDNLDFTGGAQVQGATTKNIKIINSTFNQSQLVMRTDSLVNANILIDHNRFTAFDKTADSYEGRLQMAGSTGQNSGITISNNYFGDGGCSDGIQNGSYGTLITNNEFNNTTQTGCTAHVDALQLYGSSHTIIRNNYFHNTPDGIVAFDEADNELIENNVFDLDTIDITLLSDNQSIVRHNTLAGNGRMRVGYKSQYDAGVNTQILNNIQYQINIDPGAISDGTTWSEDYNLVGAGGNDGGAHPGTHDISGSPTYVDGGTHTAVSGYTLTAASKGHNAASDGTDMGANATNVGIDAGSTTSTPPSSDTSPPTVSISSPTSGTTVSGTTTVGANASDDVGVSGVQFKLDGSNLGSEDTSSPYSISWDTASSANGNHTLTAIARDAAGNTTTAANVTVTVSNSAAPGGTLLLGNQTVQAANDNTAAGGAEAFKYTAVATGTAGTLNFYVSSGTAATILKVGVYSNNAGHPGTLLASGTIGTITQGGWNNATLSPSTQLVSGTVYWIGFLPIGGTLNYKDAATGSCSESYSSSGQTSLPAAWTSGPSWPTCTLSAYVLAANSGPSKIGDINQDGSVNIFDMSILLSHYNTSTANCDLNSDNTVNIFDLSILLSHYGT